MTDMENEIRAVKIRHLGQCPLEKDHESLFLPGLFAGMVLVAAVGLLLSIFVSPDRAREAIQRGYAVHDAKTGAFVWK